MEGDIHTQHTSDIRQVEANNRKLERQNTKLIEQNRRIKDASRNASKAATAGADRAVASLATWALGYVSVSRGIQMVTAAIKDQEEQQKQNRSATVSVATAQRNMLRNMGNVTDEQADAFKAGLRKIADVRKVEGGVDSLMNEAAMGLSASAGDRPATLGAIDVSAQWAPESADVREQITGALLDLRKASGYEDPMQNLGLLKAIGEQSRVTDWGAIAKHMSSAVIGVQAYGGTAGQAGALTAAITQGSADPEGRKSGTAAIQLAKQLAEALPEETLYKQRFDKKKKKWVREAEVEGTGLKTTSERIEYMRSHPEARERFLADMSLETKQLAAVTGILGGQVSGDIDKETKAKASQAYDFLQGGYKALDKAPEALAADAQTKIAQMERQLEDVVASGERGEKRGRERARTETIFGAEATKAAGVSSEALDKDLAAANLGWLERTAAVADYWVERAKGNAADVAYFKTMDMVAKRLAIPEVSPARKEWRAAHGLTTPEISPATKERRLEQIGELDKMVAETRQNQEQQDAIIVRLRAQKNEDALQKQLLDKTDKQTAAIEKQTVAIEKQTQVIVNTAKLPTPAAAQGQLAVGAER